MAKHDDDHDRKPRKHGPKERELALQLTVAILHKADLRGDLETVERSALELYGRVLERLATPAPRTAE